MAKEGKGSESPMASKAEKQLATRAFQVFLVGLALYLVSLVMPSVWGPAIKACAEDEGFCYDWVGPVVLTGALIAGLLAAIFGFRARKPATPEGDSKRTRFPHGHTVPVLVWLVAAFAIYLYFLLSVLVQETIDSNSTYWLMILDDKMVMEATVAFLAAGIGSTVSTTFSYLQHASSFADWEDKYTPWYFLRPIQGSFLGVIFYWLLKGGILAVLPEHDTDHYLDLDLNGLAGISALVGMFSRRAMIKLRETFRTIFSVKDDEEEQSTTDGKESKK